jgi:hypothetical protein
LDYTLADLARVTGAKRRSLQLWADSKIIIAHGGTDRAGTGTHRRFSRGEAIVACVIHAFALHQIAIGELFRIALVVRFFVQIAGGEEVKGIGDEGVFLVKGKKKKRLDPIVKEMLESAIKGRGEATFVYESWSEEKGDDTDGGLTSTVNIFAAPNNVEFQHLNKPQGFAAAILLKNYLSKIDS